MGFNSGFKGLNNTGSRAFKTHHFRRDVNHWPAHHLHTVLRLRADESSYGDSLPFPHELDLYHSHTAFTKFFYVFRHYLQGYFQSNTHTALQIRLRQREHHTHWNLIRRGKHTLASEHARTHTHLQWTVFASHKRQDTSRYTKRTQAHEKATRIYAKEYLLPFFSSAN